MKLFISYMIKSTVSFIFIFSVLSEYAFSAENKTVVDKIVATVGSEAILQSDLNEFPSRFKKEGAIDDTLLLDEKIEALKASPAEQLQFLIREKLVESEIKRQNLSFTEERLTQEMDSLAKRNHMNKSDLDVYLKKQGFTPAEYKKTLKGRLERQSFFESEIVSKLRITDEDAYNEYKIKTPNYKPNINEYKIAQIYFNPKKSTPEATYKRAEEVYKKIGLGESFESLANKFTEEKGAADGGLLGQFKTGEFNIEIERAVQNLDAGQTTAVVKTKQGFHIFKVLEKKVTQDPNFLRFKEQIKNSLVEKNFKRQLKNWFESKKQDAYIKIYE